MTTPTEQEAQEGAKLATLRSAVDTGIAALGNGDFKEFNSANDLVDYLRSLPLTTESR